ncbi:MAG: CbtB-domain containing protein [Anaerolineaceae bacterium]|nr:CbtB-domain containing protein [Anaerolineaceae bacterium]
MKKHNLIHDIRHFLYVICHAFTV